MAISILLLTASSLLFRHEAIVGYGSAVLLYLFAKPLFFLLSFKEVAIGGFYLDYAIPLLAIALIVMVQFLTNYKQKQAVLIATMLLAVLAVAEHRLDLHISSRFAEEVNHWKTPRD